MAIGSALITGGSGALGQGVARRFLDGGYRVAVTYRSEEEWERLKEQNSSSVERDSLFGFRADVTQAGSVRSAVESAVQRLGGLRVLVHLAGGYVGGTVVESVDEKTVRGMIETNLLSAFWAARNTISHLRRAGEGRLLFISSRGAVECYPGAAPYAAAKLGLHALVQTLAKELRDLGATANAVLPSIIDTPQNRASMPDADFSKWVRPEAVAGLLEFLASVEGSAISGALIPIYGRG